MTHIVTDQDLTSGVQAGQRDANAEFRARSVRYLPDRDAVEIVTTRDAGFLIPRAWIGSFAELTPEQLKDLEVWPDGSAVELETLDIQVSVHGLLTEALPAMLPARVLAGLFAGRGGQATSGAKKAAARANGRKGGRPRKPAGPEAA